MRLRRVVRHDGRVIVFQTERIHNRLNGDHPLQRIQYEGSNQHEIAGLDEILGVSGEWSIKNHFPTPHHSEEFALSDQRMLFVFEMEAEALLQIKIKLPGKCPNTLT